MSLKRYDIIADQGSIYGYRTKESETGDFVKYADVESLSQIPEAIYLYKGSRVFEDDILQHLFEYVYCQVKAIRKHEFPHQLSAASVVSFAMGLNFRQFFKSVYQGKPNLRMLGKICAYCFIIMMDMGKWEFAKKTVSRESIPVDEKKFRMPTGSEAEQLERIEKDILGDEVSVGSCDHSKLEPYGKPCPKCGVVEGSDMK